MVSESFLITHCPWPRSGSVCREETLFPSRKSLVAGKMKMKKKKNRRRSAPPPRRGLISLTHHLLAVGHTPAHAAYSPTSTHAHTHTHTRIHSEDGSTTEGSRRSLLYRRKRSRVPIAVAGGGRGDVRIPKPDHVQYYGRRLSCRSRLPLSLLSSSPSFYSSSSPPTARRLVAPLTPNLYVYFFFFFIPPLYVLLLTLTAARPPPPPARREHVLNISPPSLIASEKPQFLLYTPFSCGSVLPPRLGHTIFIYIYSYYFSCPT